MTSFGRTTYAFALTVVAVAALIAGGCTGKSSTESTTSAGAGSSGSLPPQSWVVPVDVSASPGPSQSPSPTQADWYNFGWQTFVALNWPSVTPPPNAGGIVGLPDTSLAIGAAGSNQALIPTVWLTYRSVANTMLAKGADPGAWSSNAGTLPATCSASPGPYPVAPGFQPMVLDMVSKFGPLPTSDILEASGPPLVDQEGWYVTYDIRLNQSEYTYIQQNKYYDAAVQIAAEKQSGKLNPFPRTGTETMFPSPLPSAAQFGALEVKSAWRVLDPRRDQAIIPRYYTQAGYFLQPDGQTCSGPSLFGLIGLHILRLTPTTPATWYWASFEQVDNVTAPPASPAPSASPPSATLAQAGTPNGKCNPPSPPYNTGPSPVPTGNIPWSGTNTPTPVCRVTPISAAIAAVNNSWRAQLAGTVWANYEMIGTVNPAVQNQPSPVPTIPISSAAVNTDILANTTMETYVQGVGAGNGQSCMDCHSFAAPQPMDNGPTSGTNQIFTFLLQNADTSASPAPGAQLTGHRHRLPLKVVQILRSMTSQRK